MPVFPELRPYLQAVLDELLEDFDPKLKRLSEQPVITRYRESNANLRTQLQRILNRAGVKQWEKLFQNLRSTRQTELEDKFPNHVVCAWIGNSEKVAKEHYLQVTDFHYEAACQSIDVAVTKSAALGESAGSGSGVELGRNSQRAWQGATSGKASIAGDCRSLPPDADYCTNEEVVREGLEHSLKTPGILRRRARRHTMAAQFAWTIPSWRH
ncbi:MAG: hypothetical protein WD851_10170 [Pirellulales bacterium]